MVARVLIATALVFVAGCEKRSTKYCGMHENDLANCPQLDAPPPPPVMCMTDAECTGGHCELGAHVCVECLDNTHCEPSERCDTDGTYSCRGCIADTDCTGGICLVGGSCSTDADVIYVAEGGDDDECTFAAPCATLAYAATLVDAARKVIHIRGTLNESVTLADTELTIIAAPGAKVVGDPAIDWVIKIDASIVSITGLAIDCDGATASGIETTAAHTTTLDRLDITGCAKDAGIDLHMGVTKITRSNIHDNPTAGIKTDAGAKFSVSNSWIHHNAGGGISTDAAAATTRVEFNTIANNETVGIDCKNAFEAPNNIIAANGLLGEVNLIGCTGGNSAVTTLDTTPYAFVNSAMGDYHIGPTSTAKDAATMALGIDVDYDGELRPQFSGPDLGADEYK
jgi:hypothetical protein